MDVNTNSSYRRNMDPDMALGNNLGPDIARVLVTAQATQISMAPVAARLLDTNIVSGG